MTDQVIPAEKVRERIDHHRNAANVVVASDIERSTHRLIAGVLESLLPESSRPTLADMTEDERDACQLMQAETPEGVGVLPIPTLNPTVVWYRDGESGLVIHSLVTPRPDLPRMGCTEPDDTARRLEEIATRIERRDKEGEYVGHPDEWARGIREVVRTMNGGVE